MVNILETVIELFYPMHFELQIHPKQFSYKILIASHGDRY